MALHLSRKSMPRAATRSGLVFVCAVLFALPSSTPLTDDSLSGKGDDQEWVTRADAIVAELAALDFGPPRTLMLEPSKERLVADELLWRLWLTTGLPPLVYMQKRDSVPLPFEIYVAKNAVSYRQYIDKHKHLTFEQVQRIGLTNAVDAFGSPLWYMTLKYLAERANVIGRWQIEISGSSTARIVEVPMSDEAYARHSSQLSQWLKDNDKELTWDSHAKRFRPRHGLYVGTDALYKVVVEQHR